MIILINKQNKIKENKMGMGGFHFHSPLAQSRFLSVLLLSPRSHRNPQTLETLPSSRREREWASRRRQRQWLPEAGDEATGAQSDPYPAPIRGGEWGRKASSESNAGNSNDGDDGWLNSNDSA